MFGITISIFDDHGIPKLDLKDILHALGEDTIQNYSWKIEAVESSGLASEEIHRLSDNHSKISGKDLIRVASGLEQVIDGNFIGSCNKVELDELSIYAIDSTEFDVVSTSLPLILTLKDSFIYSSFIPGMEPPNG